MSDIIIELGNPEDPRATALLHQSHALMQSLFSEEDNHYLEISDLCKPEVRFFIARKDETYLGCAALALKSDYAEVKSMFVDPDTRGLGIGDKLMAQLIQEGRANKLMSLKLETGDVLHAAHRLYYRHGFKDCGPFGDYEDSEASVFMEMPLT